MSKPTEEELETALKMAAQMRDKKIDPFFVAFLLILAYLSFLNIFVIKTTPELILLQFIILVIIFMGCPDHSRE